MFARCRGSAPRRRSRPSPWGCGWTRRGRSSGVPHPPFIGAYGPRATLWLLLALPCFAGAVALVPALLRATPVVFGAALFVGHAGPARCRSTSRAAGRTGSTARCPSARAARARTSTCPRWRRSTTARASCWTASPSSCRRCRCTRAGHPPGLLLTMHYLGLTPRRGWRRSASSSARSARRSPTCSRSGCSRSERRADRRRARRLLPRAAALRRHLRRRGLPHARPARRDPAARRGRPWLGALVLAVVSLFAWSLLAVAAWAAVLVLARDGLKPAIRSRRSPAWSCSPSTPSSRSPPASIRSAPCTPLHASTRPGSPRGARTSTGCSAPRRRSC